MTLSFFIPHAQAAAAQRHARQEAASAVGAACFLLDVHVRAAPRHTRYSRAYPGSLPSPAIEGAGVPPTMMLRGLGAGGRQLRREARYRYAEIGTAHCDANHTGAFCSKPPIVRRDQ
jgi:hypothetical protein